MLAPPARAGGLPQEASPGDGTGSPVATGATTRFVVIITIDGIRQDMADSILAPLFAWGAKEAVWIPNLVSKRRCITDPNHMIYLGVPDAGAPIGNWEPARLPLATERIRQQWGRSSKDVAVFSGKEHVIATCLSSEPLGKQFASSGFLVDSYPTHQGPDDSTAATALRYITANHPVLTLINLSQFDWEAHGRDFPHWKRPLGGPKGIERSERRYMNDYWLKLDRVGRRAAALAREIIAAIEADSVMGGRSTYVVATDHGRHDPEYSKEHGLRDNFDHAHEGDCCEGCRNIWGIIYGPDTENGLTISREVEILEIEPTYRPLLGYENPDNTAGRIDEAYREEVRRKLSPQGK